MVIAALLVARRYEVSQRKLSRFYEVRWEDCYV